MDGIGGIIVIIIIIVANIARAKKRSQQAGKNAAQVSRAGQPAPAQTLRKARVGSFGQQSLSMDMNPAEMKADTPKATAPTGAVQTRMELRPAPPAGVSATKSTKPATQATKPAAQSTRTSGAYSTPRTEMKPRVMQTITASSDQASRDGSLAMGKPAPHKHEGKPAPCPAEEREKPRPRPGEQPSAQGANAVVIPGLQLVFSKDTLLQGVVMSEILNRPRFVRGAR